MLRLYDGKLGFRPDCGKMLQDELTQTGASKTMSSVSLDDRAAAAVKRSPLIVQVFDLAAERNIPVYLVGGSVRDLLLATFSAEELDSFFLYSDHTDLKRVREEYAPGDGLGV